ncbi:MAG: DsbA family protein [Bacteroidota bacterium]
MENKNPLLCDPETGLCEIPSLEEEATPEAHISPEKNIKIVYFTDPICSSCWGIEPQLRKLKLEYGPGFEIEYRMGGLLPDWSYNSGGISKPSDVAHHWDEVSGHYDMPIDGDVWLEDPLHSSYPPSIAFKGAQIQDQKKAILFLREIREMVFLKKKNITRWEQLELASIKVGLDATKLKKDMEGEAKRLFEEDLALAKQFGVRGFPTMFFIGEAEQQERVYGSRPYASYVAALEALQPGIEKIAYRKDWEYLFEKYHSLTVREFSELSDKPREESEKELESLTERDILDKLETKNGAIWTIRNSTH